MAVVCIFIGLLLLLVGYFTDEDHSTHPLPFLSFIALQIGALFIFGAGYSAVSDYLLKRNFERMVLRGVDWVRLDNTIKQFGLGEVCVPYSQDHFIDQLNVSSRVLMLVLRSNSLFSSQYGSLISRLNAGELALTVVLPNPKNQEIMKLMSAKFTDCDTPEKLSESLYTVINVWLKLQIYSKLNASARERLKVLLIDKYPLYSAYIFDKKELWYIPYHFRNDHQRLAVLIFRREFENSEVYKDLSTLLTEAKEVDLSSPPTI